MWMAGQPISPNDFGLPQVDIERSRKYYPALHDAVRHGLFTSLHDVSDGGWIVATAELLIGTGVGVDIAVPAEFSGGLAQFEPAASFVGVVSDENLDRLRKTLNGFNVWSVGRVTADAVLTIRQQNGIERWSADELEDAYCGQHAHRGRHAGSGQGTHHSSGGAS